MIVVIAMLVGVYDLPSLVLLFAITAMMIFWGLMMEVHNRTTDRVNWTAFRFGALAGIVPWIVIGLYLLAPASRSIGDVPTFVYGIYVSLFRWFNCFAVNMFLQYKKTGPPCWMPHGFAVTSPATPWGWGCHFLATHPHGGYYYDAVAAHVVSGPAKGGSPL